MIGPDGRVVGVDMTREMLEKGRASAAAMGAAQAEFRQG
jgi:arsenite methyltransferase